MYPYFYKLPIGKLLILFMSILGLAFPGNAQIVKKPIPDKLVVLTFDDAPVTHYTYVAPLLKEYGFNATFFVCEFPPNYQDTTKYMTWKQIQHLGKMGFEVANHTHTHKGPSRLTHDEFASQLAYIEHKCDSLQLGKPLTFAYPGYDLTPQSLETLQQRGYLFARAGGSRPYNPLTDHPYLIPSWATTQENMGQIMDAFRQAANGRVVVLTLHGVPDYEHPWVTTTPAQFKQYLQYLHANHYQVISLKELSTYIDARQALQLIKPDFTKPLKNN
ncbi:polysaccharide deacetylase family protein [Rhodocytophaga aerolata]|uniref:Polysaccharide deacetylase family protein n=1 Tax=Rhodocytophaga aerolata TaxID=455078 RepID=A0ABT8R7Y8_9BACT|nr:polysaccharide deacetylase family protein [Rhodocytophaga aerolata]MDO1448218.1 polysaccharide deacetylase family protein [Rhodocytophaga aerolata]